ncbi:hypothetical protein SAMN05216588_11235 [Pseudomonas flavescens]|uniref:Uncharacterized protein n=1 Tax=Phytopseudomonas flavescens TaxID=29435 RepID=A0A1G8IBI4_9GAMM|nr:hypothetical protein [Pseudomonas flavescens]SDI16244.1 hypothetical protein SAMN05216588_11235 [Pseudomonas flavescens]
MPSTLLQLLALVCQGNAALAGRRVMPAQPVFTTCLAIHFSERRGGDRVVLANDPAGWFEALARDGVRQLHACYLPVAQQSRDERLSLPYLGGGSRWLIECRKSATADHWIGHWEQPAGAPRERPWQVDYRRVARDAAPLGDAQLQIPVLFDELTGQLVDIAAFADQQGYANFARCFARAAATLRGSCPVADTGIAPPGLLDPRAERLINACRQAWVFGGMGSWNDVALRDPDALLRYETLTGRLYESLQHALGSAVDPRTFADATGPR